MPNKGIVVFLLYFVMKLDYLFPIFRLPKKLLVIIVECRPIFYYLVVGLLKILRSKFSTINCVLKYFTFLLRRSFL